MGIASNLIDRGSQAENYERLYNIKVCHIVLKKEMQVVVNKCFIHKKRRILIQDSPSSMLIFYSPAIQRLRPPLYLLQDLQAFGLYRF